MKKTLKRILLGLVGVVLIVIIFFLGYSLIARSITKGMTPVVTSEVVNNVFSVKDTFVNLYLVKDGENYIAIDAGNDINNVKQELKKLNIDPGKVTAVLLTHTDGDHVAGISLFKNSDIYLSKQEEQLLNGNTSRFLFFGNKINSDRYTLTEDQQIISLGKTKVQCFLTPGHTPGSMSFLVNDSILFTGDALRLTKGKIEKFYSFFNMDSKTASQSIGKIVQFPGVHYLFTAHNGYTDNFNNAVKGRTLNF